MGDWIEAACLEDIPSGGDGCAVTLNGAVIAIFNLDGEIYAIDDACPHSHAARLSQGFVSAGTVECPMHQSCFDLKTGKVLCPPATEDVKTYPTRVEGGRIYVQL
jgi:NAD(P)H-dependent nitrite reductase small subunit